MSRKSITLHCLAAFLFLITCIAIRIPAQLVFTRLEKLPQFTQLITYQSVDGSLWSGKLQDVHVRYNASDIPLGDMQWSINPLYFLLGKVQLHVAAHKEQQSIEGNIALSLTKTLSISTMNIQVPATMVSQIYPVPGLLEGNINMMIKELVLNTNGLLAIEANVILQDLRYTLSQPVELGSFQTLVVMKNDIVKADVSDTMAQIGVVGNVKFTPKTRLYDVDIKLSPKPTANPLIAQTLAQFLQQTNDGAYQISKSAQL